MRQCAGQDHTDLKSSDIYLYIHYPISFHWSVKETGTETHRNSKRMLSVFQSFRYQELQNVYRIASWNGLGQGSSTGEPWSGCHPSKAVQRTEQCTWKILDAVQCLLRITGIFKGRSRCLWKQVLKMRAVLKWLPNWELDSPSVHQSKWLKNK